MVNIERILDINQTIKLNDSKEKINPVVFASRYPKLHHPKYRELKKRNTYVNKLNLPGSRKDSK